MNNDIFNQNSTSNPGIADQAQAAADAVGSGASSLASEAKAAVNDLGDRAKQGVLDAAEHMRGLAEEQKVAGADRFKNYAGSINRAADSLDNEMPMVANFARKAAGEIEHLADAVKERDLADIVGVVQDYARRQPAAFLGATALAGFVVARFLATSAQKRSQESKTTGWQGNDYADTTRPMPNRYSPS